MKKIFLIAFLIPISVFANCTNNEKNNLKSKGYALAQIADICLEEEVESEATGYKLLRVGYKSTSGIFSVLTSTNSWDKDEKEKGIAVSFGFGSNYKEGFDFRTFFSLEKLNGNVQNSTIKTSTFLFLAGIEFAYNINEYFSPFLGINAGYGLEGIKERSFDENLLSTQVGLSLGISGKISNEIGYFIISEGFIRLNQETNENQKILHALTSGTIGLTYKF